MSAAGRGGLGRNWSVRQRVPSPCRDVAAPTGGPPQPTAEAASATRGSLRER